MTHIALVHLINAVGRQIAPILLDAAWKSLLILGLAAAASPLMRRASAAMRHLLWSVALLMLVSIPLLSMLLPDFAILDWLAAKDRPMQIVLRSLSGLAPPTLGATQRPGAADASTGGELQRPAELMLVWAIGVLAGLWPVVLGTISLRAREHCVATECDDRMRRLFDAARQQLSLGRPVRLLLGTGRNMPMIWGVRRPSVLLPMTALEWSDFRLRVVLLHELGHAKRWDCLIWPLAQMVRAIYWFNPLAWFAVGQLRAEQERACDDLVLRFGTSGVDYAEQLVEVAATSRAPAFPFVGLAMARTSPAERRLLEILDPCRNRRPVGLRQIMSAALLSIIVAIPLACSHPGARQETTAPSSPELDRAQARQAAEQALRVNRALQYYVGNHANQLPPTLGATLPEMDEPDPATAAMQYVVLAPGQRMNPPKHATAEWVNANTTFTYLGRAGVAINTITRPTQTVVLYQYLNAGPGQQVLLCFLDHVEWMTRQEAEPFIAQSRDALSGVAKH